MSKFRLMSISRIKEIAKGSTPTMGEKEQLALTAIHYINERDSAVSAFQKTARELLKAQEASGRSDEDDS